MRVLLNGVWMHGTRTGVGHYTAELLRCLHARVGPEDRIHARPGDWIAPLCRRVPRGKPGGAGKGGGVGNLVKKTLRSGARSLLRGYLRATAWAGRYDVYHEPNYVPARSSVPTLTTIFDLSPLRPEWHPADRVRWFERGLEVIRRQCVHFFAITEAARREIITTLGLPPTRVTHTPLGIRDGLRPLEESAVRPALDALGLPASYLLHVGTLEPRKNLRTLLQAYCDLPAALRERCPLVLAGGWGWNTQKLADYYHETARHRNVIHLGYVPEASLAALYNGARALVFPSLYEGFGLPIVEMLACGGAVLASTADAVAEVAGRQAHLIDPHDLPGWRDAISRVITDNGWHAYLRQGSIERSRRYSWERCAAETMRVYRQVTDGCYDCAPSTVGTETPLRRAS
jgi:alpha-1,3-rhamnosyl/mannosyltransferase